MLLTMPDCSIARSNRVPSLNSSSLETSPYAPCKSIVCEHLPRRSRHALACQDGQSMRYIGGCPFGEALCVICCTVWRGDCVCGMETRADLRDVACVGSLSVKVLPQTRRS